MKVREKRTVTAGMGGAEQQQERVREMVEGEAKPEGAEEVPAKTPEHDWRVVE